MKPTVLVADDNGACFGELKGALARAGIELVRVGALEECIALARKRPPASVVVYAGMSRAFSLLRLLRRSPDLARIPLIVVGDPEQEELIAKHRMLPSRADRYMLRPLDSELARGVVGEFLPTPGDAPSAQSAKKGPAAGPPPLPLREEAPADAYRKMKDELEKYRKRVQELERDLQLLLKSSKELAALREENEQLRGELTRSRSAAPVEGFQDLFLRLEAGYKDTIEDLERLLQEKDELIQRLAASDQRDDAERHALARQLEVEQHRYGEALKTIRQVDAALGELEELEDQIGLEELLARLDSMETETEHLKAGFSFDEETVVVAADETPAPSPKRK